MKKLSVLTLALSVVVMLSSCDKNTKLKNLLEGKTWDATVTNQFDTITEVYTGTFVFDKEEFDYTSTLTDSDGNTTVADMHYTLGFEATELSLYDTSGTVTYTVDINERKEQEWTYSDVVGGLSISSKVQLTR